MRPNASNCRNDQSACGGASGPLERPGRAMLPTRLVRFRCSTDHPNTGSLKSLETPCAGAHATTLAPTRGGACRTARHPTYPKFHQQASYPHHPKGLAERRNPASSTPLLPDLRCDPPPTPIASQHSFATKCAVVRPALPSLRTSPIQPCRCLAAPLESDPQLHLVYYHRRQAVPVASAPHNPLPSSPSVRPPPPRALRVPSVLSASLQPAVTKHATVCSVPA